MGPNVSDNSGLGRNVNGRIPSTLLESVPSAPEMDKMRRERDLRFFGIVLMSALAVGAGFILLEYDSPAIPLLMMGSIALGVLLWRYPTLAIYMALLAACTFEVFPVPFKDDFTSKTNFWQNINTAFQTRGINFEALPINIFDLTILISGVFSLVQAVFGRRISLAIGNLLAPMGFYLAFVGMNYFRGWADGGDYTVMLQEVRAQVYLVLAYLMALNTFKDKKALGRVFWIAALCIALKGIIYTFRRYVTLAGAPLTDQGVGSHEEAFFFNCFVGLLMTLWICRAQRKLQGLMWLLLPFVVLGFLATNRRAGTAGLILSLPVLVLVAYRTIPHRRKIAAIVGLLMVTLGPLYYQMFKNSPSAIAQPARAIKSHFQPDERDESSNEYRDAENANIMATIKESSLTTITGYGYGKPFLKVVPMADISKIYEWWDILPHNQILWIWMRTGLIGLSAFWCIVVCAIFNACHILRRPRGVDADVQAMAIWLIGICVMLVVAGLYDLQISNYRNMVFTGLMMGMVESLRRRFEAVEQPATNAVPVAGAQHAAKMLASGGN